MNLELRAIRKTYPGVVANDDVNLVVKSGEIHALLGENGAGKSTLMKILFGLVKPDSGDIFVHAERVEMRNPNHAKTLGLGMVQQHFALFEGMSVLENIALGLGNRHADDRLRTQALDVAERYGLALDPDALVFTLSAGEKQRIEIVRTMLGDPDILILDEPTSVLTPIETEQLFQAIEKFKDEGKCVVFITHKLDEVCRLCSAATILRRGKVVGTCDPRTTSAADIGAMMLGNSLEVSALPLQSVSDRVMLTLNRIDARVDNQRIRVADLKQMAGEILGVAGVAGNGQEELYKILSGERRLRDQQAIMFEDRPIAGLQPNERRRLGCVFVPEERLGHAAVPQMSLDQNVLLSNLADKRHTQFGLINRSAQSAVTEKITEDFDVRHGGGHVQARSLSGGNLQKFVVGRELIKKPKLIIINQPTWGVDLGAAKKIHDELLDLAGHGAVVFIISQDLNELLCLCSRLAVINKGVLSAAKPIKEWDTESLSKAMLGDSDIVEGTAA